MPCQCLRVILKLELWGILEEMHNKSAHWVRNMRCTFAIEKLKQLLDQTLAVPGHVELQVMDLLLRFSIISGFVERVEEGVDAVRDGLGLAGYHEDLHAQIDQFMGFNMPLSVLEEQNLPNYRRSCVL